MRTIFAATARRNMMLIAFVVCGCFWAVPLSANDFARRLDRLREQYQSIPSIRFEADTNVRFLSGDEVERSTDTLYQYWGLGEKHRANLFYSTANGGTPVEMVNIAYNGERFQRLDIHSSILYYRQNDVNVTPSLPPNPVLYPVCFLYGYMNLSGERGVHLRAKDLYSDALWNEALANARVIQDGRPGEPMVVELLPKGGGPLRYRVQFGCDPDYLPTQISAQSPKGKSTVTIDKYHPVLVHGKQTFWPESVKCEYALGPGDRRRIEDITMREIELDAELHPGIFEIDFTRADLVWDDDRELAIKHPRGVQIRRPILADILDNNTLTIRTSLPQNDSDAPLGLAPNEGRPPLSKNAKVSQDTSVAIVSSQQNPQYIWPVVILLVSGVTLFCIWRHCHAARCGAHIARKISDGLNSDGPPR